MRFVWAFIILAGLFLSSCRGKTTPQSSPPPTPTHFTAKELSVSEVELSWQSGGGSTSRYVVSYRQGLFPPVNCNDGTVIPSSSIGDSLAVAIKSLPRGFYYTFRVCAEDAYGKRSTGSLLIVDWVSEPTPPSLLSVNPTFGPQSGGTEITLTGSDFSSEASVKVADKACLSVVWESESQLKCVLPPAESSGDVSIQVTNPNGTSTSLSGFTIVEPPPEPLNVQATVIDANQIKLGWESGGGSTESFQIAYTANQEEPTSCNEGILIDFSTLGNSTEHTLVDLKAVGNYRFRICSRDSIGGFSSGVATTAFMGWELEAYLKSPNSALADVFGTSLSLSANTLVVGATGEDGSSNNLTNSGAAYVFRRTDSQWVFDAYLKAPNAGSVDAFGSSVGISGDTVVVGAPQEDNSQTTITQGTSISETFTSSNSGAAYVFVREDDSWVHQAYLRAPNQGADDQFGGAVAISGDRILVGASRESSSETTITNGNIITETGVIPNSGAAYVFKRNSGVWELEAYLKASNAGELDLFGNGVAISGDTILVGAHQEDNGQTTITEGSNILESETKSNSGAVYVFRNKDSQWVQEAYLKSPNSGANDYFGFSVGVTADTVVVGAYLEDSNQATITNGSEITENNSLSNSGAAYVYKRTGSSWALESYLKASNRSGNDWFGQSVSAFGDLAVVGSFAEDNAQNTITHGSTITETVSFNESGAAYVFRREGGQWSQEAYLKAPNVETSDRFGNVVSGSSDRIAVGAHTEGNAQTTITNGEIISESAQALQSGAVYIFKREKANTQPQIERVFPSAGERAGQTLFVYGSGFQEGATVSVGGVDCSSAVIHSSKEILCVLPEAMSEEAVSVEVRNPGLSFATLEGAYTYPVD